MSAPPVHVEPTIAVAALTDVGRCRVVNEDAYLVDDMPWQNSGLLGVFDGCGGAGPGDLASERAAQIVSHALSVRPLEDAVTDLTASLEHALLDANASIRTWAMEDPRVRGMGTTAPVAAVTGQTLHLAHVGDSRAYLLRRGRLVQVSRDQTLLNSLIEEGRILPEEIDDFPHTNVILYAIGVGESLEVDTATVELRRDDTLLLCTDGLWGLVEDAVETTSRAFLIAWFAGRIGPVQWQRSVKNWGKSSFSSSVAGGAKAA